MKSTNRFHARTSIADSNFHIWNITSRKFRFSITDLEFLKKSLQQFLKALNLIVVQ